MVHMANADKTKASEKLNAPEDSQHARPTMQDIAKKLGISVPLVSIVMRGVEGASEATRQKVLATAAEMGYYHDESAALLRRRKSGLLGVLFTMRQPFEIDLVDALYRQADIQGYRLVLSAMGPGRSQRDSLDELLRQRIEALIVLTAEGGAGTISDLPVGLPVVTLGGPISKKKVDDVRVKNEMGITQAVEHLKSLGHKRITYIGPKIGPNAAARVSGYQAAMKDSGLGKFTEIIESDFTEVSGHEAALEWLGSRQRATGLVCANDRCAFGVLETLIRKGIKIPQEVSIVGFDDSSVSKLPFVDMTSVHPDPEQMAKLAVTAAHNRINNPENKKWNHTVPTSLAVRGSTAKPSK